MYMTMDFSKKASSFLKIIFCFVVVTVSFAFLTQTAYANEDDKCGFGMWIDYDKDYNPICMPAEISEFESSDGFSKTYELMVFDEAPVTDEFSHFMNIGCTENKLSVKFETAGAVPLAPNKAGGKALVKINDGKAISYPYNRVQDFDGGYWVELKNPKLLTTNLLKDAKKLAVKIPTSNRSIVRLFAVKDLVDFQAKFKSRGCPLR